MLHELKLTAAQFNALSQWGCPDTGLVNGTADIELADHPAGVQVQQGDAGTIIAPDGTLIDAS